MKPQTGFNASQKWMIAGGAGILLLFVVFAFFAFSQKSFVSKSCFGVISVDGEIGYGSDGSVFSGSVEQVLSQLKQAQDDDKIKSILLEINSPGGGAAASKEIFDAFSESKKPIVAYYKDIAASGGYYISTPAHYIISNPMAITGSIGAIFSSYNLAGLFEKFGVQEVVIKSGTFKDIMSFSRNMTADERALLQAMINDSFTNFKNDVVAARAKRGKTISPFAFDAKVFTPRQAVQYGLIDAVGNLQDARKKAAELGNFKFEGDENICEFAKPSGIDLLLSKLSSNIAKQFFEFAKSQGSQASLKFEMN